MTTCFDNLFVNICALVWKAICKQVDAYLHRHFKVNPFEKVIYQNRRSPYLFKVFVHKKLGTEAFLFIIPLLICSQFECILFSINHLSNCHVTMMKIQYDRCAVYRLETSRVHFMCLEFVFVFVWLFSLKFTEARIKSPYAYKPNPRTFICFYFNQ